jgi:acyl carrier protein
VAPAGDLEPKIAEVWKDVLKLAQVGTRDNFFDLGGQSLLAVQAHRRLREALQRELSITDIFRFPTIQSLAAYLTEGSQGGAQQGTDRAQGRRAALQRRQQQRSGAAATTTRA